MHELTKHISQQVLRQNEEKRERERKKQREAFLYLDTACTIQVIFPKSKDKEKSPRFQWKNPHRNLKGIRNKDQPSPDLSSSSIAWDTVEQHLRSFRKNDSELRILCPANRFGKGRINYNFGNSRVQKSYCTQNVLKELLGDVSLWNNKTKKENLR